MLTVFKVTQVTRKRGITLLWLVIGYNTEVWTAKQEES